jgi:hypothetical protein
MAFVFEMQAGSGVPPGSYTAEFVRAEEYTNNANDYGPAVLLVWKILNGEHADEETTRIVSPKLNAKTNLFKFVTALNGGPVEPGQQVDLESFYGTKGMVIVEETEGGATRVSTFLRT